MMEKKSDQYGISIGLTAIYGDDKNEIAITVKDNNGVDVETHVSGDDVDDVIADAFDDVMSKLTDSLCGSEDDIDDLRDEINSLRIDNNVLKERNRTLQAKIDELQKAKKDEAPKNAGCNDRKPDAKQATMSRAVRSRPYMSKSLLDFVGNDIFSEIARLL